MTHMREGKSKRTALSSHKSLQIPSMATYKGRVMTCNTYMHTYGGDSPGLFMLGFVEGMRDLLRAWSLFSRFTR